MRKGKRGFATYMSWISKVLAMIYAIGAGVDLWDKGVSGQDVLWKAIAIMVPFLPIDISKIRQSVLRDIPLKDPE